VGKFPIALGFGTMYRKLSSFLKQPFYEQKYIILEKFLRIFCDWAYISSHTTLKMVTKKSFYKVGYNSSPYVSKEIYNIDEMRHLGLAKYMLPCRTFELGPIGIIRYPRVSVDNPITDNEMFDLLRDLSKFSKKTKIDIMDLYFVKDFLANPILSSEERRYLINMNLSTLYGPIHGDFHRGNILRHEGKLFLTDFDMFEQSGIHYFDFLNQFCLGYCVNECASWFDYLEQMIQRWNELSSHEYWNDLPAAEKKNVFYLFVICKLNECAGLHKSSESDQRYREILKKICNLSV
jgi:hypothetical protein